MFLRSIMSKIVPTTAVQMQSLRFINTLRGGGRKAFVAPSITPHNLGPRPLLGALRAVHNDTKAKGGDDSLVTFLTEEIATEKKNERAGALPTNLEGFQIILDQSEVTLSKKINEEKVTINFNVNHTVDAAYAGDEDSSKGQEGKSSEMRSRPNFQIEITKGNKVVAFNCAFLPDADEAGTGGGAAGEQDEYQDAFVVEEISVFEGESKEQTYAVAGDIMDGYLYDLFMNMLEERGITNEFVEKISDFATDYEHKLYINLLTQLQGFLSSK